MKIVHTDTPSFKFREDVHKVESMSFVGKRPFNKLQKYIDKMEDEGYTHCYMFSISTFNDHKESLHYEKNKKGEYPIVVRWKFLKITSEIYFGENLKSIEKTLRGDSLMY
jgi:hypothetical protein